MKSKVKTGNLMMYFSQNKIWIRKSFHIFKFILFIILILVFSGNADATDYYVATNGNNSDTGLSIGHAWSTPSYAAQQVSAGDTIYLLNGTWYYENIVPSTSGTQENPITIKAYNGTPSLQGNYFDGAGKAIDIQGYDYWIVDGITINQYDYGVYVRSNQGCKVYNSTFYHQYWSAISFVDSCDSLVQSNIISHVRWNSIQISSNILGTQNITIKKNDISNSIEHALTDMMKNFTYIYIINNTYHDTYYPAIYSHQTAINGFNNSGNLFVINNTFYNVGFGIHLDDPVDNSVIDSNTIYNIHSPDNSQRHIKITDPTQNITISNNNLWGNAYYSMVQMNIFNSSLINNNVSATGTDIEYRFVNGNNVLQNEKMKDKTEFKVQVDGGRLDVEYTDGTIFAVNDADVTYYPEKSIYTHLSGVKTIHPYNITLKPSYGYLENVSVNKYDTVNNLYVLTISSSAEENPTWINISAIRPNALYKVYRDGIQYSQVTSSGDGVLRWMYNDTWSTRHLFIFELIGDVSLPVLPVEGPALPSDNTTYTPSATSLAADIGDSTTFSISTDQPLMSLDWYVDDEPAESGVMEYTHEWSTAGIHSVRLEGDTGIETISNSWSVVVSEAGSSTISVLPSSAVVAPGDTFSLDVNIDPATSLSGSQFDMHYSSLASVDSLHEGELFSGNGLSTTFYSGDVDDLTSVLSGVYSAIVGSGTISAPGTMATVNMVAGSSTGVLELALSDVVLSDANSNPAPYTVSNATVLVDSAPVFDHVDPVSAVEGDLILLPVIATDPDGDSLGYSCTSLPDGASFNPTTAIMSWTPEDGDAGDYSADFEVTDGYLNDSVSVSITVNPLNHAPVITDFEPADAAVIEEGSSVNISVGASDEDGDTLSYTIAIDGSQVSTSTTYAWNLDYSSSGSHIIEVTVSDGTNTVSSSHTVSVTDLHPRWDINEDGIVNVLDVTLVGQNYGNTYSDNFPRWDVNQDGSVNIQDLSIVASRFGETVE